MCVCFFFENPDFSDRYIVTFKEGLEDNEINKHVKSIKDMLSGSISPDQNDSVYGHFTSLANIEDQNSNYKGVTHHYHIGSYRSYSAHLPAWLAESLNSNSNIMSVQKEHSVKLSQTTIKANIQQNAAWDLSVISQTTNSNNYIYPESAGQDVDIYVLDTGVRTDHTEFEGRATFGASFTGGGDQDPHGHGTHVSGIAAGKTFGVAKKANIIAVQVLDKDGSGPVSSLMAGIQWVITNSQKTGRRSVINLSIDANGVVDSLTDMITNAVSVYNIAFAVAAGNDGVDACTASPSNSKSAVVVGSINSNLQLSDFSNHHSCVDIYAPGENIVSSWHDSATGTHKLSGTSQASPHVAGQLAVLISMNHRLKVLSIYQILVQIAQKGVVKGLDTDDYNLLLFNGVSV